MARQTINIGAQADDGTGDSIRISGVKINDNFAELYPNDFVNSDIHFIQNEISSSVSNADIVLSASGTGIVRMATALTIDSTVRMSDNEITTTLSNDDLVLSASGSGIVKWGSIPDVDGGEIDGTPIGATTPLAGTFTTLTGNDSALTVNGKVTIADNLITTNESNANLEFSPSGSGYVEVSGFQLPNTVGAGGDLVKTNGSGVLSYHTVTQFTGTGGALVNVSDINDGTTTLTGNSSAQAIDSFSATTYRSAKYHMQISDATADRYIVIDVNITHDGTNAYVSTFGETTNLYRLDDYNADSTLYDSLDISADINSGNVRLLGTVNNTNSQVIKFVRRPVKV
jgi:hypothetical protein